MNITDYISQLVAALGYPTLQAAKQNLTKKELHDQAYRFYQENNGAEGSVLWSEILSEIE